MKIAGLAEIKKELRTLTEQELRALVTDLAKFNIDNKRFLYFQLYGRDNRAFFIEMVKESLMEEFQKANTHHYHYAKKSAQSIRRKLNKFLKFDKDKTVHVELIIFFCERLANYGYLNYRHPVITNLYNMQIGKLEKLISGFHEDLQYDYRNTVKELKALVK